MATDPFFNADAPAVPASPLPAASTSSPSSSPRSSSTASTSATRERRREREKRRKKRVSFGHISSSFYEAEIEENSEIIKPGEYAAPATTRLEPVVAGDEASSAATASSSAASNNNDDAASDADSEINPKLLRFFGEAPPPGSHGADRLDSAVMLYDKYLRSGGLCNVGAPDELRHPVKAEVAAGRATPDLLAGLEEWAAAELGRRALRTFAPVDGEDLSAPSDVMARVLAADSLRLEFLTHARLCGAENLVRFYQAVQRYKLVRGHSADALHTREGAGARDARLDSERHARALRDGDAPVAPAKHLIAARELCDLYIRGGAPRELGCAPDVKREIRETLASGKVDASLFDKAEKHAALVMEQDILPTFLEMLPNKAVTTGMSGRDDDVSSSRWTLADIFQDKAITKVFLRYASTVYSEENVLFYLAVRRYRHLIEGGDVGSARRLRRDQKEQQRREFLERAAMRRPRRRSSFIFGRTNAERQAREEMLTFAQATHEKFVRAGAIYEINLPPAVKQRVRRAIDAGAADGTLFDEAQKHALNTVFVDLYPKYLAAHPPAKGFLSRLKGGSGKPKESHLQALLADRPRRRHFVKFAKSVLSQEYVRFYLDVNRFRRLADVAQGGEEVEDGGSASSSSSSEESDVDAAGGGGGGAFLSGGSGPSSSSPAGGHGARRSVSETPPSRARSVSGSVGGDEDVGGDEEEDDPANLAWISGKVSADRAAAAAAAAAEQQQQHGDKPRVHRTVSRESVIGPQFDPDAFIAKLSRTASMGSSAEAGAASAKPRTPPRPILRSRSNLHEQAMKERRRRTEEVMTAHVETIKAGAVLVKYNANRKPIRRGFSVSADGTELCWGKPSTPSAQLAPKCFLADVIAMYYGPFSNRFKYFDCSIGKSWLCIVLEFEDRTVDVVCDDERQLDAWFLGLQSLAPLNPTFLTRGGVYWARANMKIDRMAYFQRTTPLRVWADLLLDARKAVKSASGKKKGGKRSSSRSRSSKKKASPAK